MLKVALKPLNLKKILFRKQEIRNHSLLFPSVQHAVNKPLDKILESNFPSNSCLKWYKTIDEHKDGNTIATLLWSFYLKVLLKYSSEWRVQLSGIFCFVRVLHNSFVSKQKYSPQLSMILSKHGFHCKLTWNYWINIWDWLFISDAKIKWIEFP